jgi:hypothetical protein
MWGFIIWRPLFTEHLYSCVKNENITDFAKIMNMGIQSGLSYRNVVMNDRSYCDLGTYDEILELEKLHRAE